jgi:hypothetical protein
MLRLVGKWPVLATDGAKRARGWAENLGGHSEVLLLGCQAFYLRMGVFWLESGIYPIHCLPSRMYLQRAASTCLEDLTQKDEQRIPGRLGPNTG